MGEPVVVAEVIRNGFVESRHLGHAVVMDADGRVVRAWGDPDALVLPRSLNKPAQAVGMLRLGLELPDDLLAMALASHSGEPMHLDRVRAILAGAGLGEDMLQTPADLPAEPAAQAAWIRADRPPAPIAMNCSGKHAAMLATARLQGWGLEDYLDATHPLQQALAATIGELAGEQPTRVGVDGCGAPLVALAATGLARSFRRLALAGPASPEGRAAAAMRLHPELVAGTGRPTTALMQAVPGLIAKDGAEGLFAVALADGSTGVVKVADGAARAAVVAAAALLAVLGVAEEAVAEQRALPVTGGRMVVGRVVSPLA